MTRWARPRRKPILWSTRQRVVPAACTLASTVSRLRISSRPRPEAGSSRRSSSGSHMRAMAMPSIFSSPYERLPASCSAAAARSQRARTSFTRRASCASTARAAPNSSSPRRSPSVRLRARWLATRTLSNTESSAKTCGFWKLLTTPRLAMMSGRSAWISRPFHRTLPAVGARRPAIMLSSVVLPEPLGPMMPMISLGLTVKETAVTATRPAKRLLSCRTSSATFRLPRAEGAHDASRHHEDGEDEDGAVEDGTELRAQVDGMRQPREDEGAHDGTEQGALAPQQDHGQHLHRLVDGEIARIDVARVVAVEPAREGGQRVADGEGEELVAEHVDAEGAREILIETDGPETASHPGVETPRTDQHGDGEADKGEVIPGDGAADGHHAAARPVDGGLARHHEAEGAVGEAVPVQDHEADHLREGQRHHREVEGLQPELEADASHRHREDDRRHRRRHRGDPEGQLVVGGEEIGHVGGDAEHRGMEHGELAGEAEDQIEGDGEDAVDEREDEDGEEEVAAHEEGEGVEHAPQDHLDDHSSPKRPEGRKRRMATRTARP